MLEIENEEIIIDFCEETEKVQLGLLLQSQNEISNIQDKLQLKGFLTCEECGTNIPENRRKAYPSARTCVPCQTWIEEHYTKK